MIRGGWQERLRVAEKMVDSRTRALVMVGARVKGGGGREGDSVSARAQLERTRAALPSREADIRAAMHRIAVLTGQPPAALVDTLAVNTGLPGSLPVIPVDSRGDVVRRRPDVAAAERRLAAATARIGVATADLFPRSTLSGLLGPVATDSGDLFSAAA